MAPKRTFATEQDLAEAREHYRESIASNTGSLGDLFIFGFNSTGDVTDHADVSLDDANRRAALVALCKRYRHMPGQLKRRDLFRKHAELGPQIVATIRHIGSESRSMDGLVWHGFLLAALLNPDSAAALLEDTIGGSPWVDEGKRAILARAANTFLFDTELPELRSRIDALQDGVLAAEEQSESGKIASQLGLDLGPDWHVSVTLEDIHHQLRKPEARRSIFLQFGVNFGWNVRVECDGGSYGETDRSGGRSGPLGLEPLGRLEDFPTWVAAATTKLGFEFTDDTCTARAGRTRSNGTSLLNWARSALEK